ncbi:hypothetical protein JXA84_01140 [candidate division WOR-3 bacterium]|nr:hypothetical protein [candidate division WOR-3 bacterium]
MKISSVGDSRKFIEKSRLKAPVWFKADSRKVVFSIRVRLARNFSEKKIKSEDKIELTEKALSGKGLQRIDLWKIGALYRRILAERHLINTPVYQNLSLFVSQDERVSVLVNDEDDIRIQVISTPGDGVFCLEKAKSTASDIDEFIPFARSQEGVYETSCPSNRGTGMRYSYLLHLPCIFLTGKDRQVFRSAKACGQTLRGIFGEGTKTAGSFCQVSNSSAMKDERQTMSEVDYFTQRLSVYELFARENLLMYNGEVVKNYLKRGFESHKNRKIKTMSFSEYSQVASALKLALDLGIESGFSEDAVSRVFFLLRRGHRDAIINQIEGGQDISLSDFIKMTVRKK